MADIQLIADLDASGVVSGQKQIERSAMAVAKATRAYNNEFNALSRDLQKGTLTTIQYNKALSELNRDFYLFKQGIVDGGNQFARFNIAQYKATQGLKRFGSVGLQQVGYQVGDFAVQLQGGTNAAVALGQQGSQLLGIFGAKGALAGAALAITTAFIAPMIRAKEEAENLEDKLKDLNSVYDDFVSLNERLSGIQGGEKLIFTQLAESAEQATIKLRELKREKFEEDVGSFLDLLPSVETRNQLGTPVFDPRTFADFREALDLEGSGRKFDQALSTVINASNRFKEAEDFDSQVAALESLDTALNQLPVSSDKVKSLSEDLQALINVIADFDEEFKKIEGKEFFPDKSSYGDFPAEFQVTKDLRDQIALNEILLQYGKDSIEYKRLELEIDRQSFRMSLQEKGIMGDCLSAIMDIYDAQRRQTLEIFEQEKAAKAAEEAEKRRAKELENRLRALRAAWKQIDISQIPGEEAAAVASNNLVLAEELGKRWSDIQKEATKVADAILEAKRNGDDFTKLDIESGVEAAKLAAQALARALQISVEEAMKMVNLARGYGQTSADNNDLVAGSGIIGSVSDLGTGLLPTRGELFGEDKKTRGGGTKQDELEALKEQIELEMMLLGETEARQRVIQALGVDYMRYGDAAIGAITAEIEELLRLQDVMERNQEIADSMEGAFSDFFGSLVDGTTTVEEAFKDMARSILQQLWDILVVQQIVGSWSPESGGTGIVGGIMGIFKQANGNAFMGGNVIPFANGGIVNSPTLFPMANGMGLMGEAGPEAVMPLKRGKDGKLGVQAEGGGGDTFVIHQNFNFSANGDESVRRIIAQAAPEISKITQRDILETCRRGGTFKAAFG